MSLTKYLSLREKIDDFLFAVILAGILMATYLGAIEAADATAKIITWIPEIVIGGVVDFVVFEIARPVERMLDRLF